MEWIVKKLWEQFQKVVATLREMSGLMLGLVWWWITQQITVSSGASSLLILGYITLTAPRTINRRGRLLLTLTQPSYPNVAHLCLQFRSHSSLCWCANTSLSASLPTACGFQMPCSSLCQAGKPTVSFSEILLTGNWTYSDLPEAFVSCFYYCRVKKWCLCPPTLVMPSGAAGTNLSYRTSP